MPNRTRLPRVQVIRPSGTTAEIDRCWLPELAWRDSLKARDREDRELSGSEDGFVNPIDRFERDVAVDSFIGSELLPFVLLPFAVLARILRLMPWTIEVYEDGRLTHSEQVRGWMPSRRRILALAADEGGVTGQSATPAPTQAVAHPDSVGPPPDA